MAPKRTTPGTAAPASGGGEKVKMVDRHSEFQEVDVQASQVDDVPDMSGKNPHPEKSAQWAAWENKKRQLKGLPATNNL